MSIENPNLPASPAVLDAISGYGPTRSGVQVTPDTALTFTAVFAAVKILSESVGMLPAAVFHGDFTEDNEAAGQRAKDHPAYKLLRFSPNEEMIPADFKGALQANLVLWGNAFARIETDNAGRPSALWPIESRRVSVERCAGKLTYYADRSPNGGGGKFAPEEMIHLRGLSLNGLEV